MRVVCCQFDIAWEAPRTNFERARALLHDSCPPAGSLVLLPEMFSTGFSMNVAGIAEGDARHGERFLARVGSDLGAYVLGGVVTAGPGGMGRNEAVVYGPDGREISRYCKMHPFSFGGETDFYLSGSEPVLFRCCDWTVAPFICYDLRFPEVFRCAARRGAQLLCVIANWPETRETHWIALLTARAIENQAYVAGVNRCGRDPRLAYSGRSIIVDPRGEIVADAGNGENVLSAELDLPTLEAYRREFPALADIHPDFVRS